MKTISLSNVYKVLGINNEMESDIEINYVTNDITKLNDNSLVFHIKKDIEINWEELKTCTNCYIVTDQPIINGHSIDDSKFIFVLNVEKAYFQFINYYRNLFKIPVVSITGTCGKTTTKEIIRQILEKDHIITSTIGNKNNLGFNNDYLFSLEDNTEFGVFETAISYPGNLITGCEYFQPTIGVITNIGIDHLNGCKSVENYIRTKGEMLAGLHYQGTLIINNDDENIKKINFKPYKGTTLTFGINNQSDFYANNLEYKDLGMEYTLNYQDSQYQVYVPGLGTHNVYNSLAALAVLTVIGIDLNYCIEQMANVKFIRSHLELHKGYHNSTIIDDTWSSNPTSMNAALEVLREKGKNKVKILVLGKISYLGNYENEYYKQIGKLIYESKIDFIVTTDSYSKKIAQSAISQGMKPEYHLHCKNNEELKSYLECLMDINSIVLFKTSMLEQSITKIVNELIEDEKK